MNFENTKVNLSSSFIIFEYLRSFFIIIKPFVIVKSSLVSMI